MLFSAEEVMNLEIYVAGGIPVGELRRPPAIAFLMANSLLSVFSLNGAAGRPGCGGCCPDVGVVVFVAGAVAPGKLLLGVVVE